MSNGTLIPNSWKNDSDYEYEERSMLKEKMAILSMVVYSIAFVLGVAGNGLVIFITGFRMKKTVNTVWFLNLAIADFAFTLFLPLNITYVHLKFHWPFGLAMCKINSTFASLNLYASVYLLMVISIDRCISVRHPVWAQNHRTPKLATLVALGVWIVAVLLCSPIIYFRHTAPNPSQGGRINCYNRYGTTKEIVMLRHHAMVISRFILAFVIPFTIIFVCYGAIVLRLRNNRLSQSNKPFKVITAVIVAFFVCWFPFHVFAFIELINGQEEKMLLVLMTGVPLTSSLAFINSCLNPILYVFMGQDFKERLRRSLFSAFENAFTEEISHSTVAKSKASLELDSQGI